MAQLSNLTVHLIWSQNFNQGIMTPNLEVVMHYEKFDWMLII